MAATAVILLSSSLACGSSAKTSVGPSAFERCTPEATAAPAAFPPEGGGGKLTVSTERDCSWTASAGASWITIATTSGQGPATIDFSVAANAEPAARSASFTIGGRQVGVSQQAGVCRFQLSSNAMNLAPGGGSASVDVTASSAQCEWRARAEADWLVVREGATGRGNGRVVIEAGPSGGPTRAGTLIVADLPVTITQGDGCGYAITPVTQNVGASGGSGTVNVTTGQGCPWTATSQNGWIAITGGANGAGSGSVSFNVGATNGPTRTGTLVVAGQTFTVTQSQGCAYTIDPSAATLPSGGGSGEVRVSAEAGCTWSSSSNAPWLTLAMPTSGSGGGSVRFNVPAHTGPQRVGTATVAGRTFTVTQQSGCTIGLGTSVQSVGAEGGPGTVRVESSNGCQWQVQSNAGWIRIQSGGSGSGTADVRFTVETNAGTARTGTITIGGRVLTINQAAGCAFALSATSATVPAGGGTGAVDVTAAGGCSWNAAPDPAAPWVRITAGSSGNGNGRVEFSVDANSGASRSARLTIAGHGFTITQTVGCSFSLSSTSASIGAGGGGGTVGVTAPAGCAWTAASDPAAMWIRITSGPGGAGDGKVDFVVDPNNGPARSTTLSIAGQTFTVQQSALECSYSISPTSHVATSMGGPGSIAVTTAPGCFWTATNGGTPWISITTAGLSSGPGTVEFSVAPNAGPARMATIPIAGHPFAIEQASGCTFSIAPTGQAFEVGGGSGTITVTSGDGCTWMASSPVDWIMITSGTSGTGTGTVGFTVTNNAGAARSATLTVAGQGFVVTQVGTEVVLESLIVRATSIVPIVQRPRT